MVSSVTEEEITKLREARYLAANIVHRLSNAGQIVPITEPHERVVLLAHFIRGVGFPFHPIVRRLMFYYGPDFHDLAPNFILNISTFIVVCEAFLHITPHFGLWLKTFNVKPRWWSASKQSAEAPWWERCQMSLGPKAPMWRLRRGGNWGSSTSPSRATPTRRRPPNFDPVSPCGSPPGKGRV